MVDIIPTISIVYMQWLKDRDSHSKWKTRSNSLCLQEIYFKCKDTYSLKVNRWRKIYHANSNQKKVGSALLTSNWADFRESKVIRD